MVCSRIKNFRGLHFVAGYSTLQAFRGPLLGHVCHRRLQSGNDHRLRELAFQPNVE